MANETKETKNKEGKLGLGKLLLWNSRMVSTSIVTLLLAYLMIYCTDTLKVPAAYVSVILVASKLLDGVTDMVAGFIVDKTKTKWGKARPYELFIIAIWITTWMLFSTPEHMSMTAKLVWIFVTYALANSICYTFLNANNTPYIVRAFKSEQIVKLTSYGSIITILAAVIFNMTFPALMAKVVTSASGWSRLVLMFAVPLAAIGCLRMIFVPEKYDIDAESPNTEPLKITDVFKLIRTNKFILIIALMTFVFNFVCNMGVQTYYYTYIVGNVALMGISAIAQIVVLPLALFFPKLISKFSTVKLMMAGFFVSAAGYLLKFVAGGNVALLAVAAIMRGAGTIPASMLNALVIIECADYNEWKGNHRMEGTMSSLVGLGAKIGAALGAGALGVLLSMAGYTGDAATMPTSAMMMIRMLFTLVPAVLYVVVGISLKGYTLNKDLDQIRAENEANRAAKAAGEK
ncbi:MAG: MFS transporter [Eubacteriales bacterium]|nr:MFS transporter [Eubacteriales bacterium]